MSFRPRLLQVAAAGLLVATVLTPQSAVAGQTEAPCDIYARGGTPCVAAFSTTRALFASYSGPLYKVQRTSDNATQDIGLDTAGGYANAAVQDAFCAGTTCKVLVIYDHTSRHNDLTLAGPGAGGPQNNPADAAALPITVAGHKAYGLYMPPVVGYRRASTVTTGTARGGQPESMYEVASGTNASDECCSDFGNVETEVRDTGQGHMDTLNISYLNATNSADPGPWVEADLEDGVFQGGTGMWAPNRGNPSKFVTAVLRNNGQNTYSLKGGNSQTGALNTWYEGALPAGNYTPMKQEGSIVLGVGGDNSNRATGTFFEGAMTSGYSSNATDNAVQANVVAQHYDGTSTGGGPGELISAPGGKCIDVYGNDIGVAGAPVDLWECRPMAADMHWVSSDYYGGTLRTLGRCLAADGTAIKLADCSSAGNQQWYPQADGTVRNPASGRCLTAAGTSDGSALQLADCTAGALQQFVVPVLIHHRGSCVDVAGRDEGGNNAVVQLWSCQTLKGAGPLAKDQHWRYNVADHTIRTLGRCLTANGTADGTRLLLNDCTGSGGQQWVPQPDGTVRNSQSGKCVSAVGAGTANGTALQLLSCGQVATDKFQLN
ncbi:arabinofuranosidase catalytic domain-containing protein [Kribbella sp. NPDC051587]|uniref:arabinofuranosidase catalytic domain-containing protein n=1 Tax=Kribbella sp. NPDC051587 TaxID=3364119 RepID=UPI00378B0A3C